MLKLPRVCRAALALFILFALPGWLGQPALASASAEEATKVIENFDDNLLAVMKDADALGYDGRYKRLEPAIDQTFNIPAMTRFVVGPPWKDWSEAQHAKVTEAFRRFIIATYARRFDGYSGESFRVEGTRPVGTGIIVQSQIVRTSDDPVAMNYLMRDNGSGGVLAVDVFLTGTISELATRRSEFTAVLQREGYDGLLRALNKNVENKTAASTAPVR